MSSFSARVGALPRHEILGVPIAAITLLEALALADAAIADRATLHFGVVNAAKIVNMRRDPLLSTDLLASDIVLADGMPVVWASRLLGRPLPERVPGIDLMHGLLALAARKEYRVYCLGAADSVLHEAVGYIVAHHSGLRVAGIHHGYFSDAEEERVVRDIAAVEPDILFVAMTSPKKEGFMARWSRRLAVPVIHGVGGSFDVLAGRVRRAPQSWQNLGLEWAYRLRQEPRRLWKRYLVTNTLFCGLVAEAILRRAMSRD
jgi:N-acetylglucosaminyldiphosphoundecaprenol N-acetyl-beta-D-mannosaminyltransferase